MKKPFCFLFSFILIPLAIFSQANYDPCVKTFSKQECITYLRRYSSYWKNDSLSTNGFRCFVGREILRCSQMEGEQWEEISPLLGSPHFIISPKEQYLYSKNEVHYRYVVLTYGDYRNYKDVGNVIFNVIVVNGIIKSWGIQEVDG